jgi:hypothetical protein
MNTDLLRTESMNNFTTRFMDKPLRVEMSRASRRALSRTRRPLLIEMELYFGCLIRKRVRFHDQDAEQRFQRVTDDLSLAFRPVVTGSCRLDDSDAPPVEDLAIQRKQAYIPRWLRIHYRNGEWEGTFGY